MTMPSPGYRPFAIAPQNSGMVRNKDTFLIPEDAYQTLLNLYTWRGRLKRRQGYALLGRLQRQFTDISYFDSGASPWSFNILTVSGYVSAINIGGAPTLVITTTYNHGLSNGDDVVFTSVGGTTQLNGNTYTIANVTATTFEVTQAGPGAHTSGGFWYSDRALTATEPDASLNPGAFSMIIDPLGTPETITDNGDCTLTGSLSATGTINYASGAITITGAASAATTMSLGYFPGLPCMGLPTREIAAINAEDLIAFDTKYAYNYSNTNSRFEEWIPGTTWNGSNSQFFWSTNFWQTAGGTGLFWTTNFKIDATQDPIRYTDGTTWTNFAPTTNGTNEFHQALIIVPYKGREVALHTWEGGTSATSIEFPQRARWSQLGDPTDQTNGWRDDIRGRGGFVDAATNEYIVSVGFVRDLLVARFERSTWVLRYSGNELLPFYWDRVNIEFGADSTFCSVQFDDGVLAIGDKGVTICDGNSVKRIDLEIPDEVYNFHNDNNGPIRVQGIRDFENRLVYWTFPNDDQNGTFPNRVLVYNYEEGNWAFFTDSFTCYGTHQAFNDIRWQDLSARFPGDPYGQWEFFSTMRWSDPRLQSFFPNIVAGNQQGFVLTLNQGQQNDQSRMIKSITVSSSGTDPLTIESPNHNLQDGEWIYIFGVNETSSGNLDVINTRMFKVLRNASDPTNDLDLFEKPRAAITAITQATQALITAPGNTFSMGDQIEFSGVGGMIEINTLRGRIVTPGDSFTVDIDSSAFTAYTTGGSAQDLSQEVVGVIIETGSYCGGGVFSHVMNVSAASKKFHMIQEGGRPRLGHIDFLSDVTQEGEITCELYADYAQATPVNPEGSGLFNTYFSTKLSQFSTAGSEKDWHRFLANLSSSFVQYNLTFSDRQMSSYTVNSQYVEIGAIVLWMHGSGRLTP